MRASATIVAKGSLCEGLEDDELYLTAEDGITKQFGFEMLIAKVSSNCDLLDHVAFDSENIKVWIGPSNTWTRLHHDRRSILLLQADGTKEIKLISPAHLPHLKNDFGCYSALDAAVAKQMDITVRSLLLQPGGRFLSLRVGGMKSGHYSQV